MESFKIRKCTHDDLAEIADICYKTGFMGEDLTGNGRFNDKILFSYLFCVYYPIYEIDNCFVALDKTEDNIIGYIIGSENTFKQEEAFMRKMIPKIALRMCTYTIFFHPESFKAVLLFMRGLDLKDIKGTVYSKYPAHLHINILPEYQKLGIGSALLKTFELHMKNKKVSGIHIWTSNQNIKAVPFYRKHGYEIIYERKNKVWEGIEGYQDIIFGKKLE